MSENLRNIDDLFRKALDDHEETPSPNVWADIDKNLDKKKVFSISKKYRKLKWVAAALLIFSAGMAMYSIHVRLRNKELVKQNEINRKRILKAGNDQMEKGSTVSKPVVQAPKETLSKSSKNNTTTVAPDISPEKPTANAGVKNHAVSELKERHASAEKVIEARGEKALSANIKKAVREKNNLLKVTTPMATTEKEDKPVVALENKDGVADDEPYFEKTKKSVDVATANEKVHEAPAPPLLPENSSIPEMSAFNNKQTNLTAANKSVVKPFRGSRFSATVFYSKDFVSTTVDNNLHAFREDDRNEIKNKENISSSSSKGVLVNYNFSKKWSIQSGVTFSTITTDIKPKTIFARPDNRGNVNYRINCSAGYSFVTLKTGNAPSDGDSILALSAKNTLQYFAVPLMLSYNIPLGKFSLQPGAGLTANFLTKGSLETIVATQAGSERHNPDHIEGLNTSYVNGSVRLATNYFFTRNVALNFTPVMRLALSAINKDAPVKTYINSFGLAAGLTVAF